MSFPTILTPRDIETIKEALYNHASAMRKRAESARIKSQRYAQMERVIVTKMNESLDLTEKLRLA
jgi:hypothetical protein